MLSRNHLLYILAGLIVTVAALHAVALVFSLYWFYWWYDLVQHFLGGAFCALFAVLVCFFSGYMRLERPTTAALIRFAVLAAVCIGFGWELFERVLGHSWSPEGYYLDTGIDIVMDTLGGLAGALLLFKSSETRSRGDGLLE